jgi:hypothetical protein
MRVRESDLIVLHPGREDLDVDPLGIRENAERRG